MTLADPACRIALSTLGANLDWDLSAGTGSNRIEYWLKESINLSLGSQSPTDFDNGAREQREQDVNLNFVYQWQTALAHTSTRSGSPRPSKVDCRSQWKINRNGAVTRMPMTEVDFIKLTSPR